MRFVTLFSTLLIGAGVASAAQHSGRSLRHVGKEDKHHRLGRRQPVVPPQRLSSSSQYLTDASESQYSVLVLRSLV